MTAGFGNIFNRSNTRKKHIPTTAAATEKAIVPCLMVDAGPHFVQE